MLVSDFSYDLPDARIAKYPPNERGTTRLLVLHKDTGTLEDSKYAKLDGFLNAGDVLVLNDTRVMRSRLFCTLRDGRPRELMVLEKHGDEPQRVMYRGKLHEGDVLSVGDADMVEGETFRSTAARELVPSARGDGPDGHVSSSDHIRITRILGDGLAEVSSSRPLADLAEAYGTVPLPPYLHRDADEADTKRYQTVWAHYIGSAAAPTASLNMTDDLLARLRDKGVIIKYLTLHVGLGTFLPIRTDEVEEHHMHSEWYSIPDDTIAEINAVLRERVTDVEGFPRGSREGGAAGGKTAGRTRARKIIAVGTTVARTLEYYAKTNNSEGEDDIFIYPGFKFQIIDALLTNFHAPKSTVLMLAAAFAGWPHLKNAYDYAVSQKYNFLSYGDSMLIC